MHSSKSAHSRSLPKVFASAAIAVFSLVLAFDAHGQDDSIEPDPFPSPQELRGLSIEDLADLRITTAARRPEKLRDTPAAVSVVTGEDIHRGGARNIPDALRLATGVHVARADNNNTWAIGVRGFTFTTSNKLLVLRDGRSLYSPLFSGVFWDVQDTMIEDIDRIEVIRGPGATLWGANAVNGVINILSKSARETQGTLLTAGGGDRERGFGAARYGGKAGENTWYRVYVRGWDRDDVLASDGSERDEHTRFGQGGFRVDSEPKQNVTWTLQGELYDGTTYRPEGDPIDLTGGHLLGRWIYSHANDHRVRLQGYYDRVERDIPAFFGEERDTFDAEFDHRFAAGDRHDFLWGGTARVSADTVTNSGALAFEPDDETVRLFSAFLQDKIALVPDRLDFTVGSKVEHNSYTGVEVQPSIRLAWMPEERQTVWAAISRAVRTPSRFDRDVFVFDSGGDVVLRGDDDFESERLIAYELGYRVRPAQPVTFDFALFYHDYEELRGFGGQDPLVFENRLEGESFGGEVGVNYRVSEWWRLKAGYAHLQKRLRSSEGEPTKAPDERAAQGNDPKHIVFLQSTLNLGDQWAFDSVLRHVSELPNPPIPSYTELDLRLAFLPHDNLELSLVGRNLIDPYHPEFGSTHAVPRMIFFRAKWTF